MASPQFFYDRVNLFVDRIPYLPDGQVRNFSMNVIYNNQVKHGYSPTGIAVGKTVGNKTIASVNWTEYLTTASDYINWNNFYKANPNSVLTVVPVSLASGVPVAPQFTIVGLNPTDIRIGGSEGSEITRDCTFNATDSSNT